MEYSNSATVICDPFGPKTLRYPNSMAADRIGAAVLLRLQESWEFFWDKLEGATSELAEEVIGTYDFDASFETHEFEILVYDFGDWADPDTVLLRVQFLDSNDEPICPLFDCTFTQLEITHAQPCF